MRLSSRRFTATIVVQYIQYCIGSYSNCSAQFNYTDMDRVRTHLEWSGDDKNESSEIRCTIANGSTKSNGMEKPHFQSRCT